MGRVGKQQKEIDRLQGLEASQGATIKQQEEKLRGRALLGRCGTGVGHLPKKRSQRLGEEISRHDTTNTVLENLITTLSRFDVSGKIEGLHLGSLMMDVESRDQEIIELRAEIDLLRVELEEVQKALDEHRENQESWN